MRILIIGAGNPIPSFISRRLAALSRNGMDIVLVADSRQDVGTSIASEIVRIGGSFSLLQNIRRLVYSLFHIPAFIKMLGLKRSLPFLTRAKWAFKFLPLAVVSRLDIIHFQWIGHIVEFEWLKHFHRSPFVASVRGSQVTVYPVSRPGYKELVQRAFQMSDFIHCVSSSMANQCKLMGADTDKIFVNYNGLDGARFFPADRAAVASENVTLISIGALIWRKGILFQIQVLKKLIDMGKPVRLLLVGDGPDREGLLYTAHVLELTQYITFAGQVNETELPSWLGQADLCISTSVAEGLANSVVESAASGLPIVAFMAEGMEEVIHHGVNGFVVPFGDVDGMAEKIQYLIDNRDERFRMGNSSRQHVLANFNEGYWVNQMIKEYKSIEGKK